MNYTEKYHLPQWEETDRIMRTDFNQMCADMEKGIDTARNEARQNEQALSTRIANAQETADTARAEVAALYVTGIYEGKYESIFVDVGFRPTAVIIAKHYRAVDDPNHMDTVKTEASLFLDGPNTSTIEFRSEGFRVWPHTDLINVNGRPFFYIAFR